ncbi:MAG: hypothetical protein IMY83_03690 [Chloroflexi bacterium]|nr:hypothetical protein [Chloroflexota bacterium]
MKRYEISPQGIHSFLANLTCGNAKANYYRIVTTFVRWLLKMGYLKENPLDRVDKPKPAKRLLPSLTEEQVDTLIANVGRLRDKAIVSFLFDSGM